MIRNNPPENSSIPDAINCRVNDNFTQIPNNILRNPNISAKAKIILFILFSNKEGWHSCIKTIQKMMMEKSDAINSALQELERLGFLSRIKYRDKKTKIWKGSFWAYTDVSNHFDIKKHFEILSDKGFEPEPGKPDKENPDLEKPDKENPVLIIYNNNNTNLKNIYSVDFQKSSKNGYITPKHFNLFWKIYPKKVGKGEAYTNWLKICRRKHDHPSWKEIREAIYIHSESDQWQKSKKYIPNPSTWLNQHRWMDNEEEMINRKDENGVINETNLSDKFIR